MEDDRETFEQEQILRDRELTEEEVRWMHDQNDRLASALASLAAHEGDSPPTLTIVNETGKRVEFRVTAVPDEGEPYLDPDVANGIEGRTGETLRTPIVEPAPTGEARFGKRLRALARRSIAGSGPRSAERALAEAVLEIAAAIDRDADLLHGLLVEERSDKLALRQQIEAAVERLRETVHAPVMEPTEYHDVIRAEPFLEELGTIFGERAVEDGAALIARERRRQVTDEGWSAEHDDAHENGEIAEAAACYALNSIGGSPDTPSCWPWDQRWWKPRGPMRDLIRAGALLAAEIDRLRRRLPAEHESAHDRRKTSARYSRVDGADR